MSKETKRNFKDKILRRDSLPVSNDMTGNDEGGFWASLGILLKLNFDLLRKNHILIAVGILFPFIVALGIGIMFPIWYWFAQSMSFVSVIAGGIVFGSLSFTYTHSTLKKNLDLTRNVKEATLISIWLCMFVCIFIAIFITIFWFYILQLAQLTDSRWSFQEDIAFDPVNFAKLQWGVIIFYIVMCTNILFAFSLFLQLFMASRSSYYLFIISYMLATIFLGGTLTPTWFLTGDVAPGASYQVEIVNSGNKDLLGGTFPPHFAGTPMWAFEQIFPMYQLNQFSFFAALPASYLDPHLAGGATEFGDYTQHTIDMAERFRSSDFNMFNLLDNHYILSYYFGMPFVWWVVYYSLFRTIDESR